VVFRSAAGSDPVVAVGRRGGAVLGLSLPGQPVPEPATSPCSLRLDGQGRLVVASDAAGTYEFRTAGGRTSTLDLPAPPPSLAVPGPWNLVFPPGQGVPERTTLETLVGLERHADPGIRHVSGRIAYVATLTVPASRIAAGRRQILDLGQVAVMARVALNGVELGTLWHPPFMVDVTATLRAGVNRIEVEVATTIENRLIGDLRLPEERLPPAWLAAGRGPSPGGRSTLILNDFEGHRITAKDTLRPAGLIGPVVVRTLVERTVETP
jgi:hypothetical protein